MPTVTDYPDPVIPPTQDPTKCHKYDGPKDLGAAILNATELILSTFIHHRYSPDRCARLCDQMTEMRRKNVEKECRRRPHAKFCAWERKLTSEIFSVQG